MARKQQTISIHGIRTFIAIAIIALAVTAAALATPNAHASETNLGAGIVKVNELTLRSEPNTGDSSLKLGFANKGDKLVIIKWADYPTCEWYEVICNRTRAFVKAEFVAPTESFDFEVGEGEITGESVRLRKAPNLDGDLIRTLELDTSVDIIGVNGKWYKAKVGGETGYIRSDYVRIIAGSSGTSGIVIGGDETVDATAAKVTRKAASSYTNNAKDLSFDTSTTIGAMADLAISLLGTKYVYSGASTKGFDCSGFIYYIGKQYGYDLPHNASAQQKLGTKLDKSELQLGDLVFFGPGGRTNHVGMYLGDGVFIHSSSGGGSVKFNNLTDQYYQVNYRGARRVF